jgi:hypothetical protein
VGREHFLSLNRRPLDEAAAWIETQRAIWTSRLDALAALLQAESEQDYMAPAENARKKNARKTLKRTIPMNAKSNERFGGREPQKLENSACQITRGCGK